MRMACQKSPSMTAGSTFRASSRISRKHQTTTVPILSPLPHTSMSPPSGQACCSTTTSAFTPLKRNARRQIWNSARSSASMRRWKHALSAGCRRRTWSSARSVGSRDTSHIGQMRLLLSHYRRCILTADWQEHVIKSRSKTMRFEITSGVIMMMLFSESDCQKS